jgi:hypothetical protein
MRGRLVILAGVAIAVVTAVGCGDSDHHARVNPEAMLDAAAAHPIESADMEIELRLRADGVSLLSQPVRLKLEGPYRSGGTERIPSFDWRLSATALGFPVGGRLVSTGSNVYLSIYGSQYEVGEGPVAAANERLSQAGGIRLRVRRWLGPARVTGEDHAGGEDCELITAQLRGQVVQRDLEPVVSQFGFSVPAVSGTAVACVGFDDRVLHELELHALLRPSPADSARLGGATAVHLDADVVASDVGQPQSIQAPRGTFRPIRDLFLTLSDLAG